MHVSIHETFTVIFNIILVYIIRRRGCFQQRFRRNASTTNSLSRIRPACYYVKILFGNFKRIHNVYYNIHRHITLERLPILRPSTYIIKTSRHVVHAVEYSLKTSGHFIYFLYHLISSEIFIIHLYTRSWKQKTYTKHILFETL